MKFRKFSIAVMLCIVLGVVAVLWNSNHSSLQASMPTPMPIQISDAQFSVDGGENWQPVGDCSELRKQREDIILRGHFNVATRENWILHMYLQHMQMEFYVNGQKIYTFAREFDEIRPEWCADLWITLRLPETTPEDTIEIHLYSLHRFGANGATYEKTLENLYIGETFLIYQWINAGNVKGEFCGVALVIVGFVLLGIAFAALWLKSPLQNMMILTALLAIGEGLFWLADSAEVAHYINSSAAFFNVGRYVSRMLSIYALLAGMSDMIRSKSSMLAQSAAFASGLCSLVFLLLNLIGKIAFCEFIWVWRVLQVICIGVGIAVCINDVVRARHSVWEYICLALFVCAYISILYDYGDQFWGWYPEIELSKYVCSIVAIMHAASLLVQLPASHAAIRRAEKLSEELHHSRIVLAMSQIRTHFIFNVLNAISSLCKSDPELADQELVRFSRYLRRNIDIMQEDTPIPFEKALEHMHNYVDLEQLRFEEKILLDENYEVVNFMIPSLVIQPLVENAIKHGLLPKEEGGVINVSTRRYGNEVVLQIADNGVGFDTSKKIANTSFGLSNVRFRVERMMGGRLKLESTPGKGTVVQVWLPLNKEVETCTLSM